MMACRTGENSASYSMPLGPSWGWDYSIQALIARRAPEHCLPNDDIRVLFSRPRLGTLEPLHSDLLALLGASGFSLPRRLALGALDQRGDGKF